MEAFKRALEDCKLSDLGYKGSKFTWNNGCAGREFTKEHLDRGVANKEWCEIHSNVTIPVLACRSCNTPNPLRDMFVHFLTQNCKDS
jgi:hypothetical protein